MNMIVMLMGLLLTLFACAPVYATLGGGTGVHNHSGPLAGGANLNIGGNLASTKACASGYWRTAPNVCMAMSDVPVIAAIGGATGCTTTMSLGLTDAKALLIRATAVIYTTNAIGLKNVSFRTFHYFDTTCVSGTHRTFNAEAYEFNATPATIMLRQDFTFPVISTPSGNIVINGNGGTASSLYILYAIGYID